MTNSQEQVRQWGPVAEAYVLSSFHAGGPDLAAQLWRIREVSVRSRTSDSNESFWRSFR
jgi:hypothetical protein